MFSLGLSNSHALHSPTSPSAVPGYENTFAPATSLTFVSHVLCLLEAVGLSVHAPSCSCQKQLSKKETSVRLRPLNHLFDLARLSPPRKALRKFTSCSWGGGRPPAPLPTSVVQRETETPVAVPVAGSPLTPLHQVFLTAFPALSTSYWERDDFVLF